VRPVPPVVLAVCLLAMAAAPASAAERQVTLRWGPVTLGAYQVQRDTSFPRPPRADGFITAMSARVVDAEGAPVPVARVMLHHLLLSNEGGPSRTDRVDAACPDIPRERFFGRGEEGRSVDLPDGYGYPIAAGDRWRMNWMLMNHTDRPERAWIEYTMTIDDAASLTPVTPFWLDVAKCRGGSIFSVPGSGVPGSQYNASVDWKVPFDGRIIEGGAHLHGGGYAMSLRQPSCGDRDLVRSRALFGMPDDPVYRVLPVLHEPGPIATSTFRSASGVPIAKGDVLRAVAEYDGERVHPAVMGMLHVYVAHGPAPADRCAPLPSDITNTLPDVPGRTEPPAWPVPLTGLDRRGRARTIDAPPGRARRLAGGATLTVSGFRFATPNLSIPRGATLRWRFPDKTVHNVTLANGPVGFASLNLGGGGTFSERLKEPGVYRLFCSLHPVQMQQVITVR
jgi:Copper binding proteins, plastocyanin/azurin family